VAARAVQAAGVVEHTGGRGDGAPAGARRCVRSARASVDASIAARASAPEAVFAARGRAQKFAHFDRCSAAKGALAKKIFASLRHLRHRLRPPPRARMPRPLVVASARNGANNTAEKK